MLLSLLSTLLLGLVPMVGTSGPPQTISTVAIAPPVDPLSFKGDLSASGVLVLDFDSGQPTYAKDAAIKRPMASLTKLMTALIIEEGHMLDEIVTISKSANEVSGNRAYLFAGEHYTVGELLSALLIASANDAAVALAEFHSGSVELFVDEMNIRAISLGLKDTLYADPTGLDHAMQLSTPRDIAHLTKYALSRPAIAERMGSRGEQIRSTEGTIIDLIHTHALIHKMPEIIAGKTGTTDAARQCLVTVLNNNGQESIVVLLYSAERYRDLRIILEAMGV